MAKQLTITCKEGHQFTAEIDLANNRYRLLNEPDIWHDVNNIIKHGQITTSSSTPWCCSRQVYVEFMKQRKEERRKKS